MANVTRRLVDTGSIDVAATDGRKFKIIERTMMITMHMVSGPPRTTKGTTDLVLSDGRDVNFIDDNTFQIIQTGEVLKRV